MLEVEIEAQFWSTDLMKRIKEFQIKELQAVLLENIHLYLVLFSVVDM